MTTRTTYLSASTREINRDVKAYAVGKRTWPPTAELADGRIVRFSVCRWSMDAAYEVVPLGGDGSWQHARCILRND